MVIEGRKQICAYTHLHIRTQSLFVNDSFAWLEDIQSVRTLGSVTPLPLEEMERATCRAKDTTVQLRGLGKET